MSEKDIRAAIEQICTDLDLQTRKVVPRQTRRTSNALFPFLLGAGLVVTACSEDTDPGPSELYGVFGGGPTTTTSATAGGAGGAGAATATGGAGAVGGGVGGAGADGGATLEYMAPDP